jgi:amidophosphoribosyltransferase
MCGLVGIVSNDVVVQEIYDALTCLQHRGQDAAGIATEHRGRIELIKSNGLVKEVFGADHMRKLLGNIGIGHVRYPTAGSASALEAQPLYSSFPVSICLAHNGNLVNYHDLRNKISNDKKRLLTTNSDSEILLYLLGQALSKAPNLDVEEILNASQMLHDFCEGGYAIVALLLEKGLLAVRDVNGIRPLIIGKRESAGKIERMVASESVALDALGFQIERNVAPGESIFIESNGTLHSSVHQNKTTLNPCIFEFVYFARPDSVIDNVSVYKARLRMGEALGARILTERPEHDIDVVIPIPDTSRTAALQAAHVLGVKYREGFIKNRYIGRTFIMPDQNERKASVRRKLNPIGLEFQGKNVLIVDDSIVRGTTSKQIIQMARNAGANKVYFASAAPPVKFPNVYGIDMPVRSELIANGRTISEIQEAIGADWLIYQDLNDLISSVTPGKKGTMSFDTSCFSGEYVSGNIDEEYLQELERQRSDTVRTIRDSKALQSELLIGAAS